MRILHVTRDYPPANKGGISTAVGGLATAAVAAGHAVYVLSFDAWRPKADRGGVPLPALEDHAQQDHALEDRAQQDHAQQDHGLLRVQRLRAPDHIVAVAASVADFAPTVTHVHHGMLWRAAVTLSPGCPRLLSVHVIQAEMNRIRGVAATLSATAQAEALHAADTVHVPSFEAAELLRHHHPQLGQPGIRARTETLLVVQPMGLASPVFDYTADYSGLSRKNKVIVLGRFDHAKGIADLIATLPLLLAAVPDVQVRVIGGVPDNPRAERRWRSRLQQAGGERLQLLGWQPAAVVARELKAAAVGIFPSHAETFGLALLEAMAAGVAVVASDVAGHRALLCGDLGSPTPQHLDTHTPRGILVPVASPSALANAAVALLSDSPRATRFAAAAAIHARRFRWPKVWPGWAALYAGVTVNTKS